MAAKNQHIASLHSIFMASKKKSTANTIVLLDTHALIHRAYHALPDLLSPTGEPVGAVYGVATVLMKLIKELKPTHIAAAFDRAEPTFRHQAYESYKAQRPEIDEALVRQFASVRELVAAFNIPVVDAPGFEADDIIGTLSKKFADKGSRIIIASGDLDTLQLVVGDRVCVYTLRKGIQDTILYDEKGVRERFGFVPELLPDFKGLKGDPSDNIIGIKGIGEKTASLLVGEYGDLEHIYRALKKLPHPKWLKPRMAELLKNGEEEALFSRELARIRFDAPVAVSIDDLKLQVDTAQVSDFFTRFGFRSLVQRVRDLNGEPKKELLAEQQTLLHDARSTTIDVTSENEKDFFADTAKGIVAIAVSGDGAVVATQTSEWRVNMLRAARALHDTPNASDVVLHDAKPVLKACLTADIEVPPYAGDTTLAEWLIDPQRRTSEAEDLITAYAPHAQSGIRALQNVHEEQIKKITAQSLLPIYKEMELPLTPVLAAMEHVGVHVDVRVLDGLRKSTGTRIADLEERIIRSAGTEFNIQSPKQLGEVLFEKLGIGVKGIRKTSTSALSTAQSELEKIKDVHPIILLILEYRELTKLQNTYISALPDLVGSDEKIHTTYQQTGTVTGRVSSHNPNLQNIPIRTDLGMEIRKAFIPSEGFVLVSFDYSQIELRIAAALSEDSAMMDAFARGEDIHTVTAARVSGVDPSVVTKEMRRQAKIINFGILFGMGSTALSELMGTPRTEAKEYMQRYFNAFSGIERYIERTKAFARKHGYVETALGRRRYLPAINSRQFRASREAERMAVNMPIQGTEADIIKRAMIDIARAFDIVRSPLGDVRMLLQVHDELVFEIRSARVSDALPHIVAIMEGASKLSVHMKVDVRTGSSWGALETFSQHS